MLPDCRALKAIWWLKHQTHSDTEREQWQVRDRQGQIRCKTALCVRVFVCVCACVCGITVHVFVFLHAPECVRKNEGQWQMSKEELCVHGAVSDRSLCLALRVTLGTHRPLGNAGVGNYALFSHENTHTHTGCRRCTVHKLEGWQDGYLTQRGSTNTDGGCRWSLILNIWWTWILTMSLI